ncbi:L domain-like protein [Rhizoclosmatium globosum]|uniref:L domain-like protein n=1 Tax=Rhizoclosmatium globosum TaxID=329046 RepID=A0A1Y2AZ68_9FUNG|nr:L domain-like protein [Rhizoclosmatium globosum]|eukprot:ORY27590.1 L domain-like protein [Rhizoclosmatium globosum]
MVTFSDLPVEIVTYILLMVRLPGLFRYRGLSRRINEIISSEQFAIASLERVFSPVIKRPKVTNYEPLSQLFFSVIATPPPAFQEAIATLYWKDTTHIQLDLQKHYETRLARYNEDLKGWWENKTSHPIKPVLSAAICLISKLTDLNLNGIDGYIPHQIGELKSLTYLFLSGSSQRGGLPDEMAQLIHLRELSLPEFISGPFPEVVCKLTNLRKLALYRNDLEGPIPAAIGNLTELEGLYLQHNQLTGPIPQEIKKLFNLDNLHLDFNCITGEIPKGVGNLTKLIQCGLSYNELSGPIPAEFGRLSRLYNLHMRGNNLVGPVPDSISLHKQLGFLSICEDQLNHPFSHAFVDHIYRRKLCNSVNGKPFYLEERKVEGSDTTLFYATRQPRDKEHPHGYVYRLENEREV